jgi:hypothetical protein
MRKRVLVAAVLVLILPSLLLQGCTTISTPPTNRDLSSFTQLRIAGNTILSTKINVRQSGARTAFYALVPFGAGVIPLLIIMVIIKSAEAWERALEKEIAAANMPLYHELVIKKFCERAGKEISDWQPMMVEDRLVDSHYIKNFLMNNPDPLLLLVSKGYFAPILSTGSGFKSNYSAVLYDSEGNVVWQKNFKYSSKKYDRYRSIDEYKADNFKLLKEEMEFAADTIVSDFIADIKKELGVPQVSAQTEGRQEAVSPEKSSQEQTQPKEVSKDSGIISITSEPPGAKVFIDGEYKGQTPAEISLTTGSHQLFLQQQLYEPYKDSVLIEKGQAKTLNIKLSPEGGQQK